MSNKSLLDVFPLDKRILDARAVEKAANLERLCVIAQVQESCLHGNVGEVWFDGTYKRVCLNCGKFWDHACMMPGTHSVFDITSKQYYDRRQLTDR